MSPFPRPGGGWFVLALTLGLAAHATTVVQVSEEQLIDRADLVVHGIVLSSTTVPRPGARLGLLTEVRLEVQETLKGAAPGSVLAVTMPGGRQGSQVVHVPGTPRFFPGEQVCLFLAALPRGGYTTVGVSQGKYTLAQDPATGLLVASQAQGVRILGARAPGPATHALRAGPPAIADWGRFRRRIRSRAGGGR